MSPRVRPTERVYLGLVDELSSLLEAARRSSARAVNAVMTATYWEIGRRIVEFEQEGERRAEYGSRLLERLAVDLTARFGRGFSRQNLHSMRQFYLSFPTPEIRQTVSGESSLDSQPASPPGTVASMSGSRFRLPWSHYVLLLAKSPSPEALAFYHAEALLGGWSVRQLDRQLSTKFYERNLLSRNKAAMLEKGAMPRSDDAVTANEEVRDPLVLEFLDLKDEYSESDLEAALVRHLESFLMELGGEFAVVGRQRRLRIGNAWYRIDLLFFHRRLRSLVVIDLKVGEFTPADVGQMNVYLNYAKEHWTQADENPPVGLILALAKDEALARYALDGLDNKVLAREYRLVLPEERKLADELEATRRKWSARRPSIV